MKKVPCSTTDPYTWEHEKNKSSIHRQHVAVVIWREVLVGAGNGWSMTNTQATIIGPVVGGSEIPISAMRKAHLTFRQIEEGKRGSRSHPRRPVQTENKKDPCLERVKF